MNSPNTSTEKRFEELGEQKESGIVVNFLMFIRENRVWWMLPIVIVLSIVGLLGFLATTGAAPFIYTLF